MKTKIPSFTLFESVIAITIISVLISISMIVMANLSGSDRSVLYYQAKTEVDIRFTQLIESKKIQSQHFEYETFSIDQVATPHNGSKELFQIEYKVIINQKILFTEKHLLVNAQNKME
ncbi:MAG: hypothetical protein JNJ99_01815 [Crocinitomicaceae bacterium]|nr:hypothetical protein [Crocinitomicaceae bacterium]